MFASNVFIVSALALASTVQGAPLTKRIAQVIADSTAKWEAACTAAGGGLQCNPLSVTAFTTLLAAAGPCEQQDAADSMIDLAHQLNNNADMIRFAQLFAQQPRNSPTSQSVPYCQTAPRNSELNGLFQCQFEGVNPKVFVGGTAVGGQGTIPFGRSTPLSPAGSCPAHTSGGIADGSQLTDITSDPGIGSGSSGSNNGESKTVIATSTSTATTIASVETQVTTSSATTTAAPSSGTTSGSSSSESFALQNGKDAQALNAKFARLTPSSSCTAGDVACVNGSFAQCVNGAFVLTDCNAAAGLTCAALPLVNSPGTSITCTTKSDAEDRIARTGATGGFTGGN